MLRRMESETVTAQARRVPRVLSIAGSDSGGGAGIQADLKAFARCGVYGMTAITAVTWQNTVGVEGVTPMPPEAIVGQVKAVVEDIGVDAVKIGMLGTLETIDAVAEALDLVGQAPVLLDPVMVAESGSSLLEPDAREALVRVMLPRATVVTPNLQEAHALVETAERGATDEEARALVEAVTDGADATSEDLEALVRSIRLLGPSYVVLTGGHVEGAEAQAGADEAIDLFFDGERLVPIPGPRYPGGATHGSGCTHSSALAAHLALGLDPLEAARAAKRIASEAVRDGLGELGAGAGPVDVFGLAGRADDHPRPARGARMPLT
jgi:hydroxymethylpyrimidine/phosphomethylpyrimidine kinase